MKTRVKKGVCLLMAVLFCCLSVACQPTTNDPATTTTASTSDTITTTSIVDDTVTTTENTDFNQTAPSTDASTGVTTTTATVKANDKTTTTKDQTTTTVNVTSKATTTTTAVTSKTVKVYINGVWFSDFDPAVTQYTYPLHPSATAVPSVSVDGVKVTQATAVNGTASFTVGGKPYQIKFEKKSLESMLNNTYYKLKVEKKLNIGYIGGSVTYGAGASKPTETRWSKLTTDWFKKQFPDATITETNVGISATNSALGCYRIYDDLSLGDKEKRPDLIFVEFSVNDQHTPVDSSIYMESLIRSVLTHNPNAEIYIVLVSDIGFQAKDTIALKRHKSLVNTYLLPCSNTGKALWDTIIAENGGKMPTKETDPAWQKYYYDYVHPNDNGYAFMANQITKDIADIFAAKASVPKRLAASYQPKTPVCESAIPLFPHAVSVKGKKFSTARGVSIDKDGTITGNKPGTTFSFEFTGTGFGFWSAAGPDAADLEITVDGKLTATVPLNSSYKQNIAFPAVSDLTCGKHTVKVTLKKGKSGSYVLNLKAILVEGDPNMSDITLL